jgi:hypothetical protein
MHERLMTDAEAKSARAFREGILAVDGTAPPADLEARLDALSVAAGAADRPRILELLRDLVVDYTPSSETGAYRTGEFPAIDATLGPGPRPN